MNGLYFLADHIFRFRYRDPVTNEKPLTWDLRIYEDEMNKMHRDFFIMGVVIGALMTAVAAGGFFYYFN